MARLSQQLSQQPSLCDRRAAWRNRIANTLYWLRHLVVVLIWQSIGEQQQPHILPSIAPNGALPAFPNDATYPPLLRNAGVGRIVAMLVFDAAGQAGGAANPFVQIGAV